jgi:hypothetical protein
MLAPTFSSGSLAAAPRAAVYHSQIGKEKKCVAKLGRPARAAIALGARLRVIPCRARSLKGR